MKDKATHLKALEAIVGKDNILSEPIDCFGYSYDASPEELDPEHTPDFVCKVHSVQEVSAIVKYANENLIPIVPRGAGSCRSGGTIPVKGGIVIAMDKMNHILELDEKNMTVTVEPGVIVADLYNFCAQKGLYYPPQPSSYTYSTVGGSIAENAGGIRAVKYGVTSNYVMGLEVVLANGDIIHTGGKLIKNVTGYNLTQLFVGSEGTLGIVTKAILKLVALPTHSRTATAMFHTVEEACTAVGESLRQGVVPTAAELMDELACEAGAAFTHFSLPEGVGAMLVFDVDARDEETCTKELAVLEEACKGCGCIRFTTAKDQAEADKLWSMRRKLGQAVGALAPNRFNEDITVPRSQLPVIAKKLQAIADKYGFRITIYGHAGDGNLHPSFLGDMREPGAPERMQKALTEEFQAAVDCGGMLSGEHGIGLSKQPYINMALSDQVIDASLLIKKALDPNNILNPGKIFNR